MVIACRVILGFSRRSSCWLLSMTAYIIQTTVSLALGLEDEDTLKNHPFLRHILPEFPKDDRAMMKKLPLDTNATVYAACPACHATYAPVATKDRIPSYLEQCTFRRYGSQCGEPLVRPKVIEGVTTWIPIRPYIVFDFKDWLSGLLSRPGYEELMDGAWDRMQGDKAGEMRDVFHGSTLQNFKGPDGQTHFSLAGGEGAGRYVFALSFDSFNPLGNKTAGKKVSVGMISLVCLNLPIDIRYRPENMFLLGIIPHPEPPVRVGGINGYIKPIVDAFLEFWEGVYFTKTYLHGQGRLIFCAIVAVICDLPAARKIGGASASSHEHYCTVCCCSLSTHQRFNDFKTENWVWRTGAKWRRDADRYWNAPNRIQEASTFDKTGVRYSELLRLPYYEPTRFLVVDSMHNLFLGLIKEHFQGILGFRAKEAKQAESRMKPPPAIVMEIPPDPRNPEPQEEKHVAGVHKLILCLEAPMRDRSPAFRDELTKRWARNFHLAALLYVGHGIKCLPMTLDSTGRDSAKSPREKKMTKMNITSLLVAWVGLFSHAVAVGY